MRPPGPGRWVRWGDSWEESSVDGSAGMSPPARIGVIPGRNRSSAMRGATLDATDRARSPSATDRARVDSRPFVVELNRFGLGALDVSGLLMLQRADVTDAPAPDIPTAPS